MAPETGRSVAAQLAPLLPQRLELAMALFTDASDPPPGPSTYAAI